MEAEAAAAVAVTTAAAVKAHRDATTINAQLFPQQPLSL